MSHGLYKLVYQLIKGLRLVVVDGRGDEEEGRKKCH